jgi:predicted PurR-regulated permease PerM
LIREYHEAVKSLKEKIDQEQGFTTRLEEERKRFAKEMSKDLTYDMTEIDAVFNQMETQVIQTGGGWSAAIVNCGMILVIVFSMFLYMKLRSYEAKNS